MPDGQPPSKAGTYSITAIDKERRTTTLAAGMAFRQAVELRWQLWQRWPDFIFIVEPDDPALFADVRAVYQIIGVNEDCTRTPLMKGMTLEQAEAARDELVKTSAFLWVWIEREPG